VYEGPPLEDWLRVLHFQMVVRRSFLQLWQHGLFKRDLYLTVDIL
jgi:hypothetical protein